MNDETLKIIINYFNRQNNIGTVYLFGSATRGNMRKKSDIDIAVLFSTEAGSKLARFDQLLTIAMNLESIAKRHMDVVDAREVPLVLQHQILKYGRCIVENDSRSRISFEVDSRRSYFDMKRVYDTRNKALFAGFKEA